MEHWDYNTPTQTTSVLVGAWGTGLMLEKHIYVYPAPSRFLSGRRKLKRTNFQNGHTNIHTIFILKTLEKNKYLIRFYVEEGDVR